MKKNFITILVIVLMTIGVAWLYIVLPGGADSTQAIEVETETEAIDTSITFEDIYREYKANELRAKEKFYDKRYQITAKINKIKE